MPKLNLTCGYCNHTFTEFVYSTEQAEDMVCSICKDSGLTIKSTPAKANYFGYEDEPIANAPDPYIKRNK